MSLADLSFLRSGGLLPKLRVRSLLATAGAWSDARATRRCLDRLTDHELDDIGLTRSDIGRLGHRR